MFKPQLKNIQKSQGGTFYSKRLLMKDTFQVQCGPCAFSFYRF